MDLQIDDRQKNWTIYQYVLWLVDHLLEFLLHARHLNDYQITTVINDVVRDAFIPSGSPATEAEY